ncbi:MAG: ATP-dependent DNA ligase [Nanoarchaeota archaeon]|nr:ATP-dependent DNA ligase [Nanoarchaeota archaeon]
MKFGEYTMSMNPIYADISIEEVIGKHGGESFGEIKEDGYRCQIHADGNDVRMFTRAGNEYVYECYPEIVEAVQKLNLKRTVLDVELKGESIGYEGFIQMRKRFRRVQPKKPGEYKERIKNFPLKFVVFDTLMFEGEELLDVELSKRRKYTDNIFGERVQPSEIYEITSEEQFDKLFQEKVKKQRHEGFVLKKPSSIYIGKPKELCQKDEEHNWIKVKNFETLDLVVVALYKSKFAKELKFSSALCAMKNNETGLYSVMGSVSLIRKNPTTENSFAKDLEGMITKTTNDKPANIYFPEKIEKKYENLTYVRPEESQLIEVRTMNLEFDGKDYGFRIAYANDIREDKDVSQTTTFKEVKKIHEVQGGEK